MTHKVAVVGAGIIGMTNAIVLLENGFDVTVFTKDDPLDTNSDAAVATWFTPNDDKPLLQQCCLESLPKFEELIKNETPGVNKISEILYFKNENDFKNSVWAKESVRKLVELSEDTDAQKVDGFPFSVLVKIPLINPTFYRPHMLEHFKALGGELKREGITSLSDLTKSYSIVINSPGWEAKHLTPDDSVYPIRGQTETFSMISGIKKDYSLNVEGLNAYVVFRPAAKGDGDCVVGATFQVGDADREIRTGDKHIIINNVSTFFPVVKKLTTISKVGIRCGRDEVRIEEERKGQSMIVHCYGHGGSGYSASWGSANKILEYCNDFAAALTLRAGPKI